MTSPVSMPAGHAIVATDLDAYENLTAVWTSWTPVWGSFGTQPAVGDGTISGKYIQAGKFVVFGLQLVIGSTSTFGTSLYTFTTPTTVGTGIVAVGFLEDNSTGFRYRGVATIDTPTGILRILFGDGATGWTQGTPITLATSDVVRIAGIYEAA